MASAIISAFPRPPTHIPPSSPLRRGFPRQNQNIPSTPASSTGTFPLHLTSTWADDDESLSHPHLPATLGSYHSPASTPLARSSFVFPTHTRHPSSSYPFPHMLENTIQPDSQAPLYSDDNRSVESYPYRYSTDSMYSPSTVEGFTETEESSYSHSRPSFTSHHQRTNSIASHASNYTVSALGGVQRSPTTATSAPLANRPALMRLRSNSASSSSIPAPPPSGPLPPVPSGPSPLSERETFLFAKVTDAELTRRSRDGASLTGSTSSPTKRTRLDGHTSNRLSYISVSSSTSTSSNSKKNKRLSSASVRTFLGRGGVLDVNAEEVQTDDGAEEAGERLLRASQGVDLIAARLSSKASQESLRSLGPPPSGEDARDRPKYRSVRSSLLSFYGHLGEDEDEGAKMGAGIKSWKEDTGPQFPPPAIVASLDGVRQGTAQRVMNVSALNIESNHLHRKHIEIDEERVGTQEITRPTTGFGSMADGLTAGGFDRPRPSIDSTLSGASGASNVTATPTNAAAKFAQRQHAGSIPALNLTTASPIAPRHEVEFSDDELDSLPSNMPRSRFQAPRPSGENHRPSTPPTPNLSINAGVTMEDGDRASVLSDAFMFAQESSLRAARETLSKSKSFTGSTPTPTSVVDLTFRPKDVPQPMRRTGMGLRQERHLPLVPREDGASSPDILDMIRRGREKARLMNPNSRRRSTGAWRTSRNGNRPPLRRQRTTIGAESRNSWIEYDKSDLSLLDDAVSLRSFRAKDEEEKSIVGKEDASVYAVEDERQGFDSGDDDDGGGDGGHSSDSSLDLHTPLPHLMLRAGLLSPHSKILRPPSPELKRQASIGSMSFLTVPQNNERRKRRHRDGKMLREGVGLTTGLGWSDSEDEDAPSPLTRRLSSLTMNSTLTRKASMAVSIHSAGSHQLARRPSLPSFSPNNQSSFNFPTKSRASSDAQISSSLSLAQRLTGNVPSALLPAMNILSIQQTDKTQPTTPPTPISPPVTSFGPVIPSRPLPSTSTGLKPVPSNGTLSTSSSIASGRAFPITPVDSVDDDLLNIGVPEDVLAASITTLASVNPTRGRSWTTPGQVSISTPKTSTSAIPAAPKTPSRSSAPLPKGMNTTANSSSPTPSASGSESAPAAAGGNFSLPTRLSFGLVLAPSKSTPATLDKQIPSTSSPSTGLRKPALRGLQPLTLPRVVAAGGKLSPRAGAVSFPSSPTSAPTTSTRSGSGSIGGTSTSQTPKKTNIPTPGTRSRKNSTVGLGGAPPSAFKSRSRAGSASSDESVGSGSSHGVAAGVNSNPKPVSKMPQLSKSNRSRTLSGAAVGIPSPVFPPTTSVPPPPTLGTGKSSTGLRQSGAQPRTGDAKLQKSENGPPVTPSRIGVGSGMVYKREGKTVGGPTSGTAIPTTGSATPSRLQPPSSYGGLTRKASAVSLAPSSVGVAL